MATIRTQFRGMFASSIILLLVVCSLAIWFWARYIVRQQAQALIRRDVSRLASEIIWQPQLGAFELRMLINSASEPLTSKYWQICDPAGRIIWKSDSWKGFKGEIPFSDLHRATPVFEIPSPNGKTTILSSARNVTIVDESPQQAATEPGADVSRGLPLSMSPGPASMLAEFPPAVRSALQATTPGSDVIATEIEFQDEQFKYEVITRKGDELLELEFDPHGKVLSTAHHRVPTDLPAPVKERLELAHPGARIRSFDWRASQGYLQFLVTGVTPAGEQFKEGINSSGQLVPLYFPPDGKPLGRFQIIVGDEQRWRHGLLRQLGWILAGVCGSGLIAAWILSVWLADRALQPMGAIARNARLIDERRLSERLSGGRPDDEIGILVTAINGMLDRIESAFDRQRRFARDASHELRGPLTGLIAQLEIARSHLPPQDAAGLHLDRALERGQRLRDLIEKLLLLARQESDQPMSMRDDVEIDECITNVVADFPDGLRERIRFSPLGGEGDGHFVHGNEELLHAMFRNIIDNALKFSGPDQPVEVSLRKLDKSIRVQVRDRGPGIPPVARDHVFEPFVRLRQATASDVEGSGLGLSIVKWIAGLHQATVEIDSDSGDGTRFGVLLPEARDAKA